MLNNHYECEMEQLSRDKSLRYWKKIKDEEEETLNKYSLIKSQILTYLSYIDPDDVMLFWRSLMEDAVPLVVDAAQKSTKPHSMMYL